MYLPKMMWKMWKSHFCGDHSFLPASSYLFLTKLCHCLLKISTKCMVKQKQDIFMPHHLSFCLKISLDKT